jgi:hypothetical protein
MIPIPLARERDDGAVEGQRRTAHEIGRLHGLRTHRVLWSPTQPTTQPTTRTTCQQHNQTMRLGRLQWLDGDRTERARGDTDLTLDGSAVAVVVLVAVVVGGEA